MVGAVALVKPLLGIRSEYGIMIVGFTVIIIVVTAGMVSTTWVQFIKGSLLVIFCFILTVMILNRGLATQPRPRLQSDQVLGPVRVGDIPYGKVENLVHVAGGWQAKPYLWLRNPQTGEVVPWRF